MSCAVRRAMPWPCTIDPASLGPCDRTRTPQRCGGFTSAIVMTTSRDKLVPAEPMVCPEGAGGLRRSPTRRCPREDRSSKRRRCRTGCRVAKVCNAMGCSLGTSGDQLQAEPCRYFGQGKADAECGETDSPRHFSHNLPPADTQSLINTDMISPHPIPSSAARHRPSTAQSYEADVVDSESEERKVVLYSTPYGTHTRTRKKEQTVRQDIIEYAQLKSEIMVSWSDAMHDTQEWMRCNGLERRSDCRDMRLRPLLTSPSAPSIPFSPRPPPPSMIMWRRSEGRWL